MAPAAAAEAGALVAVVGAAPEFDGLGAGLLGVGVGVGDGVGDDVGDGDPVGLPLAVGLGLGFWLQVDDGCEDGAGEPDDAAAVPPLDDDGEGTWPEGGPPFRLPPPWLPEPPLWMVCAELIPPFALDGVMLWVRPWLRASAPVPTTSTNAAAAASGRSQPCGAGAPPAVTGRSQRSAAAGKERSRSANGPGPDVTVSVASHAAVSGRGA